MKTAQTNKHAVTPGSLFAAAVLFFCLAAFPLAGETAEGPPEGVLWASTAFSADAAPDSASPTSPGNTSFLALGFGFEYGVLPWISLSANWKPGLLISGYSSAGPAGSFSDFSLAFRFGLLGEQALIKAHPVRLALIAGVKTPLPADDGSAWEPDTHLWGAQTAVSFDYLPLSIFQVNLSLSALLNPKQASNNPAFHRQAVLHPLDLTAALEPKLTFLNPGGAILSFPLVYEFFAESTIREKGLGDGGHFFSLGAGYTIALRTFPLPWELSLRFLLPAYSVNRPPAYRVEFTAKVEIPIPRAKPAPEEQ
jgi:hypothetical protein